jgi:nitroreductase
VDLFDAIELRASVRELEAVEIPAEHLERILDAGRRAPSGMNAQPLEYLVVRERAVIEKLAKVQGFIKGASVVVFIVADPAASQYWLEDAAAAAENMLLAVAALGYGSTWVEGMLLRREAWAKELLGVPEHLRLIIALPIGKPARPPEQALKKPLADLVHYERYGRRDA